MNKEMLLVVLSVLIGTVGQLCIKAAMLRLGPVALGTPDEVLTSGWRILQQPLIWVALPLYGVGFLAWAAALSRLQLSFAHPLLAIGYLLTPFAAMILFNEQIPPVRWVGILVIIAGIVLVGRS